MQKSSALPTNDAVELLQHALNQGCRVVLSLATQPIIDQTSPLVATCCMAFGLTQAPARVVVELMEHGYVSRADLLTAMSPGSTAKLKTVDVVVCRLRPMLAHYGITITTIWGQGFKLDEAGRDKVRQMLADYNAGLGHPTVHDRTLNHE